ncbi:peptidoglycan/LPS O-acetylase OafA/YrhL [Agrococcus sp. UYP10]
MVVFSHTAESAWPGFGTWSHAHIDLGRVGIVAFFLVSGYVVGLTLSGQSPRTFAVRRFWRLYPVYWLATSIWVVVWLLVGNDMPAEMSVWAILVNITMVQSIFGMWSILTPAWTLGIEIAFYAQAIAAKLSGRFHWVTLAGWVWLAAFAALALSNLVRGTAYSAVIPLMLCTASVGFALFRWDTERDRRLWPLLIAVVVGGPALGFALGVDPQPGIWPPVGFGASYLGGFVLFAVFWSIRKVALSKWLLWLGAVSYSLYLVHVSVIQVVGHTPLWDIPPLGAAAATVLSLVAAGLLHRFVERPSTKLGRQLTTRVERAPLPVREE